MFRFLVLGLTFITFTPKQTLAGRIVGGTNATIEEFPYQVSLQLSKGGGSYYLICGGSILSQTVVLTAAHCLQRNTDYFVRYGSSEHASGGTVVSVKHKVTHEKFEMGTNVYNDIGLLFLNEPIKFSEKASKIKLPATTDSAPTGEMLTITGWGQLGSDKPLSKNLQKLKIPKVDPETCRNKYNVSGEKICVGFIDIQGKGTCNGDSGGPLVWEGKQYGLVVGRLTQYCAQGKPNIFTDIAYFREWIDSTAKKYNETIPL